MTAAQVVGIDMSYRKTAVVRVGAGVDIDWWTFGTTKEHGDWTERAKIIGPAVLAVIEEINPVAVCVEAESFGSPHFGHQLGQLRQSIMAPMHWRIIPVAPTKLKLFTTGSGRAEKFDMTAAMRAIFGRDNIPNQDVGDAAACACYGRAVARLSQPLPLDWDQLRALDGVKA